MCFGSWPSCRSNSSNHQRKKCRQEGERERETKGKSGMQCSNSVLLLELAAFWSPPCQYHLSAFAYRRFLHTFHCSFLFALQRVLPLSHSLTITYTHTHTHTIWAHLTLTQRNANDASLFRFGRRKRKKKTRCENVGKREEKRKANESSDAAELCSQWVQCLTKKHWNSPTENVSVLCVCVSRRFAGRLVALMFATSGKNASK